MLPEFLAGILVRDLKSLKRELEAIPDEAVLWQAAPGITNTVGVLARHLTGNLRHFIGAQLGGTGYVRDRDAEFAQRVSRAELVTEVDEAIAAIQRTMPKLTDADMAKPYPLAVAGMTTGDFLMHLAAHFAYHLGQLDYLRRFLTGEAGKIGALLPTELSSAKKAG